MDNIRNKLLDIFRELTAKSTGLLVIEVLVKWGYKRTNTGHSSDEREPAYRFWYKLKEISSDFNFGPCFDLFVEGTLQLDNQEATQKSDLLLIELQQLPYEESINELASACYLWLSCCRLEQYKTEYETAQDAKKRFCTDWAIALGIV